MSYTCHSGGADGADICWENEGYKYGVRTVAYSFHNHQQYSKNQRILSIEELNEGFENILIANKTLNKRPEAQYPYVRKLLARNWFQVKNSTAMFAIGKLISTKLVDGGTGWAVQMAIDNRKELYVFDQNEWNGWVKYNYNLGEFFPIDYIPKLTENFAGIGSRDLKESGKLAIQEIYKHNFVTIL